MIPAVNSRMIIAADEVNLYVRGERLQRIDVVRSKGSSALGCKGLNLRQSWKLEKHHDL
jgi:hypothetical protein